MATPLQSFATIKYHNVKRRQFQNMLSGGKHLIQGGYLEWIGTVYEF